MSTTFSRSGLDAEVKPEPTRHLPTVLGGLCLLAAPLLITAGTVTSPEQASQAPGDYIASLARDPLLSSASATLLHYGWVAMAFGALAAMGLVRGTRGRVLTLVGGLATAFGAIQMSGILLSDWYLASLGNTVSPSDAVRVFEGIGDLSISVWLTSAQVGAIVAPAVLFLGLARAGVISWWLAPLPAAAMIVPGLLPDLVGAAVSLLAWSAAFVAGLRILSRSKIGVRVREPRA